MTASGGAFAAINAGTHTGTITISITANISTEDGSNALNASGSGSASYTSIAMSPTTSNATVSSSTTALIKLNGASNVTIDGRIGGSGSNVLSFSNSNTGGITIQLTAGASNNTIKYTNIYGENTSITAGTVTVGSTGSNNNNTITYCPVLCG